MRNVSIFKKLAWLFLKCYVGQQNRSVGCQFVTFVLKQNHCSLTVSFCLSFAKTLPGIAIESCITTELSTSVILGLSRAFCQLGTWLTLPAWDSLAALFALHTPTSPISMWPQATQ